MKKILEMSKIREVSIAINKLQGLNEIHTFYYDETNNIRKLYLRDSGFNGSVDSNFVLGGVMHDGTESHANIDELLSTLNLQQSIKEIKIKYLAKGDFINCLKSEKLNNFLSWLYKSDLYAFKTLFPNLNVRELIRSCSSKRKISK